MTDDPSPVDPPVLPYQTPNPPSERWKTIWRAANPIEANLAVNKLQDAGLHARVDFENTASLGFNIYAPGGTSVQVVESEIPAAREILNEIEQRHAERLKVHSVACPYCNTPGARRVLHPSRKIGLALAFVGIVLCGLPQLGLRFWPFFLVVIGIGMMFWPLAPYWRCASCGRRFHAPEPQPSEESADEDDDREGEDDA